MRKHSQVLHWQLSSRGCIRSILFENNHLLFWAILPLDEDIINSLRSFSSSFGGLTIYWWCRIARWWNVCYIGSEIRKQFDDVHQYTVVCEINMNTGTCTFTKIDSSDSNHYSPLLLRVRKIIGHCTQETQFHLCEIITSHYLELSSVSLNQHTEQASPFMKSIIGSFETPAFLNSKHMNNCFKHMRFQRYPVKKSMNTCMWAPDYFR